MKDKLKELSAKLLEKWNNYTKRQRTAMISIAAAVVLAIVLLVLIINHTTYKELIVCDDSKSAGQVVDLLNGEGIAHKSSQDGLTISVPENRYTDAIYLIGGSDVTAIGMSWEKALDNSMTTTESEKSKKQQLAFQSDLRQALISMENIEDAIVFIDIPKDDGTIFAEDKEPTVSVTLTLSEKINENAARGIAKMLAGAVGSTNTDNITIIDSESNLLFSGQDDVSLGGTLSSVDEYRTKLRNQIGLDVESILLKYGYDDAQVSTSNIVLDMNKTTEMFTEYTPADGLEQGLYSETYNYSAKGTSGSGGIPGTDPNDDDTDYQLLTGGNSNSEVKLDKAKYLPNERVTNMEREVGAVVPGDSSLGIVVTDFVVYNEDEVRSQGLLEGISWEEFILQNDNRTAVAVPDDLVPLVSAATGINNLQISAFQQPIFNNSTRRGFFGSFQNWLLIIVAALIVALLIFVVFRGTAPLDASEEEPELSVEQLLATTKDDQSLEDIEFSEGSETRRMIEKFVDENPEAVAQLLRNWLNDDWD